MQNTRKKKHAQYNSVGATLYLSLSLYFCFSSLDI